MNSLSIEEIRIKVAEACGKTNFVGLKKRGLWYRPNACGYTSHESEAGRYTREEAKKHEYLHDEPVTVHEFSTPNYPSDLNLCFYMRTHLNTQAEKVAFLNALRSVVGRSKKQVSDFDLLDATALEQNEAFLRAKGLWPL